MDADAALARLFTSDAREDPYPHMAAFRELGVVVELGRNHSGVTPFSAASAHFDVVDQVLRDPGYYKKGRADWRDHPVLVTFETSMMFNNPPDHPRHRGLFQKTFTPRRLAALEPGVERVVAELLDAMADKGSDGSAVDFVKDFAEPMPALIMAEFMGIPVEDLDFYRARVQIIDAYLDIDGKTPERLAAANQASLELRGYYGALIRERRERPTEDLISGLVQAMDADGQVTEDELISNLIIVFNASFQTTISMLGSGMPLLLTRPDVVAALPGNARLADGCVTEILRCEPPAQFLTRAASQDTELFGVSIPAHSVVLLLVAGANRDPARFADPDRFDPYRANNTSLSFGAGMHFCLGAAVSRMEGRLALPRIFERFPRMDIAGDPVRTGNVLLRGLTSLPMTIY